MPTSYGIGPDGKSKPFQVDADGKLLVTGVAGGGGGGGGGGGDASAANQSAQIGLAGAANTLLGALNETAPASDTAASGLNGRLQRMAQRLAALIAMLPVSLGAKPGAASLSVVTAAGAITSVGGSITVGGTAQLLVSANTARTGLTIQNTSAGDLRVSPWGVATAMAGYKIAADQLLVLDAPHCGVGEVSVWGAAAGQTFQAAEAL